ncbi:MAG TPA: hypothetical protein DEB06_10890 [Phycisphaerales bacterium]|nr:hypothetical protein [Phycisphaerales bacterium]
MSQSFKPGQNIRCTVTRSIRTPDDRDTVMRLMRLDPDIKRGLKKAQERRLATLVVRGRGGRPWPTRRPSSKIARAEAGESWTIPYTPLLARDIASVASYLKIEAA